VCDTAVTEEMVFSKHWRQQQRLLIFWQHFVHFFRKMFFYGKNYGMYLINVDQDRDQGDGSCQQGNKPLGSIKCWETFK
jgi:hypothetical protein